MDSLHTKYRPISFDGIVGHKECIKSLVGVLDKKTCRTFIFSGPSGVGKTTLARIIASEVGCIKQNVLEIDAATHTGIDSVRELNDQLMFEPLGKSKVRVIIVDEAHALSRQAWQAMLKGVEEPSRLTYWIFCTTELHKIPDTIRTRCLVYELKPVHPDDIYSLIQSVSEKEGLNIDDKMLGMIADASMGSPRRALVSLSKCAGMTTKAASRLLNTFDDEQKEPVELARLLVKGGLAWDRVQPILLSLKDESPEGIRLVVLRYVTTTILNTKGDRALTRLFRVLSAFSETYNTAEGFAPLLLSIADCMFE